MGVELNPCRRAGCTGVKSGAVGVDETDEKRNVGVGGAPCPTRCFFCKALARLTDPACNTQPLRPAKKQETSTPNLPLKRRSKTSNHLCTPENILELLNNVLKVDCTHITHGDPSPLTALSCTNFESDISKARIEQLPITP